MKEISGSLMNATQGTRKGMSRMRENRYIVKNQQNRGEIHKEWNEELTFWNDNSTPLARLTRKKKTLKSEIKRRPDNWYHRNIKAHYILLWTNIYQEIGKPRRTGCVPGHVYHWTLRT